MPTLDETKASMLFVLHKLDDVRHLEMGSLSRVMPLSEASILMDSVSSTILEKVHDALVNAALNLVLKDALELMTKIMKIGNQTETVIHNFLDKAGLSKPPVRGAVEDISSTPVNLFLLHMLGSQMHEIKSDLQKITIDISNTLRSAQWLPVTTAEEMGLVGYGDHQKSITEELLASTSPHRLQIAITGPEAAGKSILAQNIYRSVSEKYHFDVCFWLFDITPLVDILGKMLIKLGHENSLLGCDEEHLISRISETLRKKRYLVVIENISMYEKLREALPDVKNGSRVLITTLEEKIDCIHPLKIYKLPPLTEQERQELIFGKTSKDRDNSDIQNAAKVIAVTRRMKPRMLTLLGGHLRFNRPILKDYHFISEIRGKTDDQILTSIYNKLPSVLLTCLTYMAALFPVNYLIHFPSLIQLWIAEEFISDEEKAERCLAKLIQKAERCLAELIQRGFVRAIPVYYHNQDNQQCHVGYIHPRLHSQINNCTGKNNNHPIKVIFKVSDLVQSGDNEEADYNNENYRTLHRLAFHSSCASDQFSSFKEVKPLPAEFKYQSLHSLFLFRSVAVPLKFSEFGFLRVLAIYQARIQFSDKELCWLDGLINLRYLGFILCCVKSGSLGEKLGSLKYLQTLDLSESFVSGLSKFMKDTKITVIRPIKEELPECWSPIPEMWGKTDNKLLTSSLV